MPTDTTYTHGGTRPGAGRPRTDTLDAGELRLLLHLLEESSYGAEYADTAERIRRMIAKQEQ